MLQEGTNSARIFTPLMLQMQIQSYRPILNGPHFMIGLLHYSYAPPKADGGLVTTKLVIGWEKHVITQSHFANFMQNIYNFDFMIVVIFIDSETL